MTLLPAAALALTLLAAPDAGPAAPRRWADPARCPTQLALKGMGSVVSAQRDWKILHGHFQLYGACDDGPLAEGYSHDVVALLTQKWKLLGDLGALGREDPDFLAFVLAHLDASAETLELETVRRSAERSCPPGEARLCRDLAAQATRALEERAAVRR